MTTALDTKMAAAVLKLLTRFGKDVVFESSMSTEYDPATGNTTSIGERSDAWKITPPEAYNRRLVDGSTVRSGDVKVFFKAALIPFDPEASKTLVVMDDERWEIVSVTRIFSGDDIVLFEAQLRK